MQRAEKKMINLNENINVWKEELFIASAEQTVFNLRHGIYAVGKNMVQVYKNGSMLIRNRDYYETAENSVTTTVGCEMNDTILIRYQMKFSEVLTTFPEIKIEEARKVANVVKTQRFKVSEEGQRFTLNTEYLPGNNTMSVYVNGVRKVSGVDYQEESNTTVKYLSSVNTGDDIEFRWFAPSSFFLMGRLDTSDLSDGEIPQEKVYNLKGALESINSALSKVTNQSSNNKSGLASILETVNSLVGRADSVEEAVGELSDEISTVNTALSAKIDAKPTLNYISTKHTMYTPFDILDDSFDETNNPRWSFDGKNLFFPANPNSTSGILVGTPPIRLERKKTTYFTLYSDPPTVDTKLRVAVLFYNGVTPVTSFSEVLAPKITVNGVSGSVDSEYGMLYVDNVSLLNPIEIMIDYVEPDKQVAIMFGTMGATTSDFYLNNVMLCEGKAYTGNLAYIQPFFDSLVATPPGARVKRLDKDENGTFKTVQILDTAGAVRTEYTLSSQNTDGKYKYCSVHFYDEKGRSIFQKSLEISYDFDGHFTSIM